MTEQLPFHFSLSCIGEGNGNPLQCACLENPRDSGAWWAAIYGGAQSWTQLKRLSSSSSSSARVKWCQDLVSLGTYSVDLRSSLASLCFHFPIYQSVQFSCSVVADSLQPHGLQHPRLSTIPVHHQVLELAQTHIHRVSDAIQTSHPLSSPPPAFNLSQHHGIFQFFASGSQRIGVSTSVSILPINIQD